VIEIENLSKIFDPHQPPALDHISALLPAGKMIGLAGPDGAGKTTLIRLIAGLMHPNNGSVTVNGHNSFTDQALLAVEIGYMPQKFGLYEDLTVQENLTLYADLQGIFGKEREESFNYLLDFTDLHPFTDRLAGDLSGGMKQKLGLACTLIRKPKILLLDEPSVGVDPISRRELWKMVKDLIPQGISVIWSTAYLDEAEKCDLVLLLNEGKLLYYGTPTNLTSRVQGRTFLLTDIQRNKRDLLTELLKEDNVLDGVIQGKDVRIVVKKAFEPVVDLSSFTAFGPPRLLTTPPRFEDAFIDILGGCPKTPSRLAAIAVPFELQDPLVVNAKNLTKEFGSFTAVDDISFEIQQGEIFGFLGPNGAGKSTTFKMLCGLLTPTSGEAFVLDYDLQAAPSIARSHIGYMAQKFSLYGDLSVYQNLNFFAGIYNMTGAQKKDAIRQMTDIFHFKQYLDESAGMLPLGYKQRLALACSVMHQPEVLFLDEPTSGVDPLTRREFWGHINGLVEKGVTIMVSTHFMDEAEYCDRIALVYKSKVIMVGTPEELKMRAQTEIKPNPTLEDAFIHLIEAYDSGQ
jgi:ABC-2 type transport system ATP-binding protein